MWTALRNWSNQYTFAGEVVTDEGRASCRAEAPDSFHLCDIAPQLYRLPLRDDAGIAGLAVAGRPADRFHAGPAPVLNETGLRPPKWSEKQA